MKTYIFTILALVFTHTTYAETYSCVGLDHLNFEILLDDLSKMNNGDEYPLEDEIQIGPKKYSSYSLDSSILHEGGKGQTFIVSFFRYADQNSNEITEYEQIFVSLFCDLRFSITN